MSKQSKFLLSVQKDYDAVNQMIATVYLEHSRAFKPQDKLRIFAVVQKTDGFDGSVSFFEYVIHVL
jgi:hypothetical protein